MEVEAGGYGDRLVAVLSAATDLLADLPARVSRLTGPDLDVVRRGRVGGGAPAAAGAAVPVWAGGGVAGG